MRLVGKYNSIPKRKKSVDTRRGRISVGEARARIEI